MAPVYLYSSIKERHGIDFECNFESFMLSSTINSNNIPSLRKLSPVDSKSFHNGDNRDRRHWHDR